MRILIADDSLTIRDRLLRRLRVLPGVTAVYQARTGTEALAMVHAVSPDVVVLDIELPQENGIRVLEAIKRDRPEISVVVFTNFPYPQYRKKCRDLGAEAFFDKFYEFENVVDICRASGEHRLEAVQAGFPAVMMQAPVPLRQHQS